MSDVNLFHIEMSFGGKDTSVRQYLRKNSSLENPVWISESERAKYGAVFNAIGSHQTMKRLADVPYSVTAAVPIRDGDNTGPGFIDLMAPTNQPQELSTDQYDYIVSYYVDMRNDSGYEVLNSEYISLRGSLDATMYHNETVENAFSSEFLPVLPENVVLDKEKLYRLTYKVICEGDKTWTDYGFEYDAWEVYEFISLIEISEKDMVAFLGTDEGIMSLETDK